MSNARAHRRRLSKARRDRCDHLTAALIACRVGGCTCEPDLSVRHVDRVPHIAAASSTSRAPPATPNPVSAAPAPTVALPSSPTRHAAASDGRTRAVLHDPPPLPRLWPVDRWLPLFDSRTPAPSEVRQRASGPASSVGARRRCRWRPLLALR